MKSLYAITASLFLTIALPPAQAAVAVQQPNMVGSDLYAKGMHVIITGSGSALADPERGGASAAVIVDGTVLQFDLGRNALENLLRADVEPTKIDYLFFTHHHFDHIASYGYFLISNWISGRQEMVQVFGPEGTMAMTSGAYQLHASDIVFGHDVYKNWPADAPNRPTPEPPYVARDAQPGVVVSTPKFKVKAMHTVHYTYPGATQKSFAYRVDSAYGSVVISGDTGPMEEMSAFAQGADVLIHEAQRPDPGMVTGGKIARKDFNTTLDGKPRHGGGHTSPSELGEIARKANIKTLVATHLPPYTSVGAAVRLSAPFTGQPPGFGIWSEYIAAMRKSYPGSIILAQDAMVLQIGTQRNVVQK